MNDIKAKSHPLALLIRLGDMARSIRDLDYLIPQEVESLASQRPEFLRISRLKILSHITERERTVQELCQIICEMGTFISPDDVSAKFTLRDREFAELKNGLERALGRSGKEQLVTLP